MLINQKFPLCFSISLLLWQLIRTDATSDYNIKAYKDAKHNQGLRVFLPIAVLGMCMFKYQLMVIFWGKLWLNDLDLSSRNVKVIWKWY